MEQNKEKSIAKCKKCSMKFSVWVSDSKTCPECDSEVEFMEQAKIPIGVSQWMEVGKKFGYDKYFWTKQSEEIDEAYDRGAMEATNVANLNLAQQRKQLAEQLLKEMDELETRSDIDNAVNRRMVDFVLLSECKEVVRKFI